MCSVGRKSEDQSVSGRFVIKVGRESEKSCPMLCRLVLSDRFRKVLSFKRSSLIPCLWTEDFPYTIFLIMEK